MDDNFAFGWVTKGWSRKDEVWIELGSVGGLSLSKVPPEISIHDVAKRLNELEGKCLNS